MSKTTRRLLIVAVLFLAASNWFYAHRARAAAAPQVIGPAGCVSFVPREWGEYKGGSEKSGLAFQDSAGTLRFVTNVPCGAVPLVALEIRRSNPSN